MAKSKVKAADEIRCGNCNRLLAKGIVKGGKISIKCKCGSTHTVEVESTVKPAFQDGMGLVKKEAGEISLDFEIKHVPDGQ